MALEKSVGRSVELVVRTIHSQDVCPLGSSLQVVPTYLTGNLLVSLSQDDMARETLASQVIREFFEKEPGFELTGVEYGVTQTEKGIVVAYVDSMRRIAGTEISAAEAMLQERLGDPALRLLMRVNAAYLQSGSGRVRTEWTNPNEAGDERSEQLPEIEAVLHAAVKTSLKLWPLGTQFRWTGQRWRALIEVAGPRTITTEDVRLIQESLPDKWQASVEVLLWSKGDFIATRDGYTTYERLTDSLLGQRGEWLHEMFNSELSTQL